MADATKAARAELERILAVYGANRSRWPSRARQRMDPFIAENREAAERLSAERAFEKLISSAEAKTVPDSLADRIMAKVSIEAAMRAGSSEAKSSEQAVNNAPALPQDAGRTGPSTEPAPTAAPPAHEAEPRTAFGFGRPPPKMGLWLGAAAMTLCLSVGFVIGVDPNSAQTVDMLVQTVALDPQSPGAGFVPLDETDDWLTGESL